MQIQQNVSLSGYSTMRLGGPTRYLAEAREPKEVAELVNWAAERQLTTRMIGSGSNIVWRDEGFDGLIIVNKITGRSVLESNEVSATVFLNGGENWDEAVAWTVGQGLSGLEFLSLIPGSVGAAPVQNIGAYGGELARVIKEVNVYDTHGKSFVTLTPDECNFSYRNSRFKSQEPGRFMILSLSVKLAKDNPQLPFYESLQRYFDEHDVTDFTPQVVRDAVIAIRSAKLPDPKLVANNGSFFTNPFVTSQHFEELKAKYPEIKGWPAADGRVKLAAGWLVEKAGFRGFHDQQTGMATWQNQALVLVNEHARSTADLLAFRQKITFKVEEMFGVKLEQEPELLP